MPFISLENTFVLSGGDGGDAKSTDQLVTECKKFEFQVDSSVPNTGLMLVGWGGNNGTTVTAACLANRRKLQWETREGTQRANWLGSMLMSSTAPVGIDARLKKPVHRPLNKLVPMINPEDLVIGGWDICSDDLAKAMDKAQVLEPGLKDQIRDDMAKLKPLASIYSPDFIAPNQKARANNLIDPNLSKRQQVNIIKKNIADFALEHNLNKIIVLWTATTERCTEIIPGVNDTAAALLTSLENSHSELPPSQLFAVACIESEYCCAFINGSPQNTNVPGLIDLAAIHVKQQQQSSRIQLPMYLGGDDFKSGQTKLKATLTDMILSAGMKPLAITSYNHLGNNDGHNLSEPPQFKSKKISKSGLVEQMVSARNTAFSSESIKGNSGTNPPPTKRSKYQANNIPSSATPNGNPNNLSIDRPNIDNEDSQVFDSPDHTIVIKYVPAVGDSKRALDEYYSEILMGGRHTLAIHNTCEDSLLASPIIIDLVLMTEFVSRVMYKPVTQDGEGVNLSSSMQQFHPVLSILAYWLKAPLTPPVPSSDVVESNADANISQNSKPVPLNQHYYIDQSLWQQRLSIERFLKLCSGQLSHCKDDWIMSMMMMPPGNGQ